MPLSGCYSLNHDHVQDGVHAYAQEITAMIVDHGLHGLPLTAPPPPSSPIPMTIDDVDPGEYYDSYDYDGYNEYDRFLRNAPITFSSSVSSGSTSSDEEPLPWLWAETPDDLSDDSGVNMIGYA